MDKKNNFIACLVFAALASNTLGFKPDDDVTHDSLNEAKLRPFEEAHQFCLNKPGQNFERFKLINFIFYL